MATNACTAPPILNTESTMLARLSAALRNYRRNMMSLRQWQFRKKPGIEQALVIRECLGSHEEGINDGPSASSNGLTSPAYAEFIRSQSQLMEDMLKAIILAAGGEIDNGLANRNRSKTRR